MSARRVIRAVENWDTLKKVAARGFTDAIECLAMVDVLERMNAPAVIAGANDDGFGKTMTLYHNALWFKLQHFVVRAYLEPMRNDDRHLRAAMVFLREPDVLPVGDPDARHRLESALLRFDLALADARLERLTHMRHKQLAHLAEYSSPSPPTYVDLFEFGRLTSVIWEDLAYGCGVATVSLEAQMPSHRRSAELFCSTISRATIAGERPINF
jgi:hypothetical protein